MAAPRVLFVQNQLCGRSWRAAKVLSDQGHPVTLLEMSEPSHQLDYSVFRDRISLGIGRDIRSMVTNRQRIIRGIRDVVREHHIDVIHSHNTPDNLSAWTIRHVDVPVIHDVHDLQTLIPLRYGSPLTRPLIRHSHRRWERTACHEADAVVVVSDAQRDIITERYRPKAILVIPNKAIQGAAAPRERLSEKDGRIHVVYAGTFTLAPQSHRNFLADMKRVARDEVQVHVYPLTFNESERQDVQAALDAEPHVHYHDPVPTTELVEELAQYDYGWLHFPVMTDNIRSASATKLYEYVLAGVPAIVNTEGRIAEFVRRTGCGILVGGVADVVPELLERRRYPMPLDECRLDAGELLGLYEAVVEGAVASVAAEAPVR